METKKNENISRIFNLGSLKYSNRQDG